MNYDVIGDIHGHADKLIALLRKLGYRHHMGAWRHPERTAILLGDFIDRGPRQLETIRIVREMLDAGSARAVMGNHEFNAIAWHAPDPASEKEHLRPHTPRNYKQHKAFLDEAVNDPALHRELVDWFLTLPLWLDLPGLRVVHACWHPQYIAEIEPHLKSGRLDPGLVIKASRRGSMEHRVIDALIKGPEIELAPGHKFHDKDGNAQNKVRVQWWDSYDGDKPVFFGHYWRTGILQPLGPKVACVDYSAGNGGPLVAYRWEGEPELSASSFVST